MSERRTVSLTDKVQIPSVGFGTYLIPDNEVGAAVTAAIRAGYRHVDTAEVYRNAEGVGAAIQASLKREGLVREQLFVTGSSGFRVGRSGSSGGTGASS